MRTREGGRIVDEAAVIARVRAGQPEAYADLVRARTGIALRAAAALGAGADAEDVVQQAFVKAYCALGRFRDGMAFKPWLLAIVANETRNTVRTAARQRTLAGREAALTEAEPLIPESADPAVATLRTERRAALLAALEKLSEEHRLVVTYWLTLGEKASAGGVPDPAPWFPRPHLLGFWLIDRDGDRYTRRERTAGPTLLWTHSGADGEPALRLEGVASKDRALEIARSLERPSGG
ncbi:RNA polymerase sigma factor [Streptomyces fumanus]|uniref:RNA polymerase sigma factor n=1 Tax=Streptomyces fumanus TaxID=67302 RepID=UPI003407B9D1